MAGLYKKEREEVFDTDGWYHTGDRGYVEDGTIWFGCSSLGVTSGGDRDDVVVVAGLVYALAFLGQVERPESWPIPVFANGS